MKKPTMNPAIFCAFICAFIFMAVVDASAAGGKAGVEAAKSKGIPVFVDFGRTTCNPCKMMVPVLDSLARKYKGRMEVVFVHVDEEKGYALKMGVTMIPTQILLDKDGKEVSRHVGYMPLEDCEKMIAKVKTAAPGKVCPPGKVCK
jgi:thioredoxin